MRTYLSVCYHLPITSLYFRGEELLFTKQLIFKADLELTERFIILSRSMEGRVGTGQLYLLKEGVLDFPRKCFLSVLTITVCT